MDNDVFLHTSSVAAKYVWVKISVLKYILLERANNKFHFNLTMTILYILVDFLVLKIEYTYTYTYNIYMMFIFIKLCFCCLKNLKWYTFQKYLLIQFLFIEFILNGDRLFFNSELKTSSVGHVHILFYYLNKGHHANK